MTVDASQRGRRSKAKGSSFESRVATLLTKFTGVNYRRTPNSGGLRKSGIEVAGHVFCGDLMCDRADSVLSIEAKNRADFKLPHLLYNPDTDPFTEWWFQTVRDANEFGRVPILFLRAAPGSPEVLVALPECWSSYVPEHLRLSMYEHVREFFVVEKSPGERKKRRHRVVARLPVPILFNWKHFAEAADPEILFGEPSVKDRGEIVEYD